MPLLTGFLYPWICRLGPSPVYRILSDIHVISDIALFFLNIYLIFHMTVSFSRCSQFSINEANTVTLLAGLGFLWSCCYGEIPHISLLAFLCRTVLPVSGMFY